MSQYIKLEDVQNLLENWHDVFQSNDAVEVVDKLYKKLPYLQTINPEAMIEEMIEEINQWWVSYIEQPITILKEAKSRIQNNHK